MKKEKQESPCERYTRLRVSLINIYKTKKKAIQIAYEIGITRMSLYNFITARSKPWNRTLALIDIWLDNYIKDKHVS